MVKINIGAGVSQPLAQVLEAPVLVDWLGRLDRGWHGKVTIDAVDARDGQVHMIQMTVARRGNPWPIRVTLRSETVDVLVLVTDGTRRWIVFVAQEREASGGRVFSNVAGGREWSETVESAAIREVREELDLGVDTSFRISFTRLIPRPVLATPGITNERVYMMRAAIEVSANDIEEFLAGLRGKKTGVTAEGEDITLSVVPADDARSFIEDQPDPDAKTLLSRAYAGL